jgi:signal transduction histidine kinase
MKIRKNDRRCGLKNKIIPPNDVERVQTLRSYKILDTPSEDTFRNLAETAALIFDMPVGFVAFVDDVRVFYKDSHGHNIAGKSLPRDKSVCSLVILRDEPTIIKDITKEPCMLVDAETAAKAGFRFFAGAPVRTQSGHLIGSIAVADYNERKFTEKNSIILQRLADMVMRELEMRLISLHEIKHLNLTIKIRNLELASTKTALLESQKELDNFLYRASHDLKGPIATIAGLLHLSRREISDPAAIDFLEKIEQVNANMNEAINKLVVIYSLLRDHHHDVTTMLNPATFDDIVQTIIFNLKHKIQQKGIQVFVEITEIDYRGHLQFIQLILANLIENAVHFHKTGNASPQIRIRVSGNTDNLVIKIFDNGDGIPPEYQSKIFDLFFRGHNSARSGMGLYIVKKLTEKAGGNIRFISIYGQSTEFIVSLPRTDLMQKQEK